MAGKRYYWLKLKKDFFIRHDIRILEAMPNGTNYSLLYLKLMVESIDHEGYLRFSDKIPYTAEMLSTIMNTTAELMQDTLDALFELGLIEYLDDGTIFMVKVPGMIGSAADNDNAVRQQRYRDRKKSEVTDVTTNSNASVTDVTTNSNERIEIEKEIDIDTYMQQSFTNIRLNKVFNDYLIYRKVSTDIEKEKIKDKLVKLANCDEEMMIRILEQSMEQGWKGLYPIKKDEKKKTKFSNFDERDYSQDQFNALEKAMTGG